MLLASGVVSRRSYTKSLEFLGAGAARKGEQGLAVFGLGEPGMGAHAAIRKLPAMLLGGAVPVAGMGGDEVGRQPGRRQHVVALDDAVRVPGDRDLRGRGVHALPIAVELPP